MSDVTVIVEGERGRRQQQIRFGVVGFVLVAGSFLLAGPDAGLGETIPGDLASRIAGTVVALMTVMVTLRNVRDPDKTTLRRVLIAVTGMVLAVALWVGYLLDERIRGAVVSVVVAIVVSAALFVGANRWFDSVARQWSRFSATTGLVLGLAASMILVGNRQLGWFVTVGGTLRDLSWALVVVISALAGGLGYLLSRLPTGVGRLVAGIGGGAGIGVLTGLFLRRAAWPAPEILDVVIWPAVGALVFLALARLRGRRLVPAAVTGATLGFLVGSFLLGDLGNGTAAAAVASAAIVGAGAGARVGLAAESTLESRLALEARARVVIFLSPALIFISATLLIPTFRTILISFQDRASVEFVGWRNYVAIFTDPNFFTVARWPGIFTAAPYLWATALFVITMVIVARGQRQVEGSVPITVLLAGAAGLGAFLLALFGRNGGGEALADTALGAVSGLLVVAAVVLFSLFVSANRGHTGLVGGAGASLVASVFLLTFALFANLRGTFFNNVWWVVTVTAVTTGVGLAVAALADRSRGENIAKSIIFMPMAISFVGAAIIWRFMYIARPEIAEQTGVLNALWTWLGRLSTGDARWIVVAVIGLVAVWLAYVSIQGFRAGASAVGWANLFATVAVAWLAYRFAGPGIGGFQAMPDGGIQAQTIQFLTVSPYNNFWLMVPFIWIYTGYAMVIFSAAIKGVPADLLEAARVDGATESQMFWRVTVPQIAPTIGVVITTVMVTVMKVFDIVKVMTNGNFGTQVLANEMWTRSFTQRHFGQGSAIAVVLFVLVLPLMYINIRRMQREVA